MKDLLFASVRPSRKRRRTCGLIASACQACLLAALPGAAPGQQGDSDRAAPAACARTPFLALAGVNEGAGDLDRVAELAGQMPVRSRMIRRPSSDRALPPCERASGLPGQRRHASGNAHRAVQIELLPLTWANALNSAYPIAQNNGAVWTGRGVTSSIRGGAILRWWRVSATLAPVLAYQQNSAFRTLPVAEPGHSRFIYPWHAPTIDWPQRFGEAGFWTVDAGQSTLRVDAFGAMLGLSNESLWWGPALRNPILLSNNAPGFPHFFAGTSRPLDVRVGHLQAEAFWGRLSESDYFDADAGNDQRLWAGFIADFQPRWLPGLFLSAARVYLRNVPPQGFGLLDYLLEPYRNLAPTDTVDTQMLAISARWVLPGSGFELYAEWVPGEFHWDGSDEGRETDRDPAYTLGFQKLASSGSRWVRVYGELTNLQNSLSFRNGKPTATYYTHPSIRQGYTHRGQILGAAIGPGSESQILGADVLTGWGRLGLYGQRVGYDDDAYHETWAENYGFHGHDVAVTFGVHQLFFLRQFDLGWETNLTRRRNRNFISLDGVNWNFRKDWNWGLRLLLSWRPFSSRPSLAAQQSPERELGRRDVP
ncbi:MAG: hypothetical protein HY703_06055 [Gemmatimonadetes bacterium]|nr:hypothetical protein [Gemmatimonadota bacterium]